MPMQIRRLTRLTNAFSKTWENLWAALCLRVTAAMEAEIAAFPSERATTPSPCVR